VLSALLALHPAWRDYGEQSHDLFITVSQMRENGRQIRRDESERRGRREENRRERREEMKCTAQHSTAQHSAAQHCTVQHSTVQHSIACHSIAQHSTAQCSSVQFRAHHSSILLITKIVCIINYSEYLSRCTFQSPSSCLTLSLLFSLSLPLSPLSSPPLPPSPFLSLLPFPSLLLPSSISFYHHL
jgi:hypothetical protein